MNPIVKNGNRLKWKSENVKNLTDEEMFSDKFSTGPVDWRIRLRKTLEKDNNYCISMILCYDSDNKEDKNWICEVDAKMKYVKQIGDGKHIVKVVKECCFHDRLSWKFKILKSISPSSEFPDFLKKGAVNVEVELNFKYYDFSKPIPNFTDITIQVEDTEFHLNKWALGSRSKYFYDLFLNSKPNENKSIKFDDVKAENFCYILASFYPFFDSNLGPKFAELIEMARKFDVPSLHQKCEQYLIKDKEVELIDKIEYAEENDYEELMKQCIESLKTGMEIKLLQADAKFGNFKDTTKLRIMHRLLDFF